MTEDKESIRKSGDRFQEETKYSREGMKNLSPEWGDQVSLYKSYPDADCVVLPDPAFKGGKPVWEVIASRRSYRDFLEEPIDLAALGQLLWASQGITARTRNFFFRAAPSAGALYPVETYVACHHVEGAQMGLFHYNVPEHKLELLIAGDLRDLLLKAGLMQPVLYESSLVFIWSAVVKRSRWKYHQRAWRYIYLDCGHLAQNLALAAEALGLGCCLTGAFFDDEINELLGVDPVEEPVVYMCAVGPRDRFDD
ncbi:MAG TPA: SagB/ThcOx family dehydrogenase [Candidatus Glassbacteria bacterium]|nr:SagB/ThcOx family dehydrogenase [Candidatus Glassbacteria bacterium]